MSTMKIEVEVFCLGIKKYLGDDDLVTFLPTYYNVFGNSNLIDEFNNHFTIDYDFINNLRSLDTFFPECLTPKTKRSNSLYNMFLDTPLAFAINQREWRSKDRLVITLIPFHIDFKGLLLQDMRNLNFSQ
ncbi:hypothetical protein AS589_11350 [Empedobacter brevis]|uniref:Uncharacterized protein n=3 Tax=Empedobacter brevis TaxID=247 RepID=A0A511NCF4_9FLAO|nr:hypothetical protein AS589_11350 [Empedobacter brevis]GEM50500.1 hypothetical protein EB1_02900 [Empedobacter brevis NBRC 14943 = ATCC 43319]